MARRRGPSRMPRRRYAPRINRTPRCFHDARSPRRPRPRHPPAHARPRPGRPAPGRGGGVAGAAGPALAPPRPPPAGAGGALPLAEGVEWQALRDHCRQLLDGLDALKAPLPADEARALRALLGKEPEDPRAAVVAVQRLLDAHCLVGVAINPESRVKAVRGPLAAELRRGQERVVLIKVHNEAGVTHPLTVDGPELAGAGPGPGRWLEARVASDRPFSRTLG